MNVRYRKLPDATREGGYNFYPLLQVFLRHQMNMRPILALVDSGSSDCIFPVSLGEVLGLDAFSGKRHTFHAFDSKETEGFVHKVDLQVTGFSHWISLDVVFIASEVIPILGQVGFFENYQIVFERFTRRFEVNTKADAVVRKRGGRKVR